MGFFNEDNMGHIVSIITTDLIFCEETAMTYLGQLTSAYFNIALSIIFYVFYKYLFSLYLYFLY